ncbi:DUF2726 domain-containing protein [Vibrio rotiferianus]|uniref:DUF2726 domain-containing protein n=1 Tax=Vibrio rotiferianus TaxID=190895 RepID=UPI00148C5F14|nr:DUF2726 domain-containing protein [Vibrio rotiferianus]NOH69444.1 DUF2726 domain-containing protein [Vibrio rotiferianus]
MTGLIVFMCVACIVYVFVNGGKSSPKYDLKTRKPSELEERLYDQQGESSYEVLPLSEAKKPISQTVVPHKKSTYLATKAERKFYGILQELLSDEYVIHCQVSLMALVQPVNFKDNSKTWAKRMDYVITDKDTRVLAVIELDDSSHSRPKRQERDIYVNEALLGHHPLLRFSVRGTYDPLEISNKIEDRTEINVTKHSVS